jgi:hypothetical protein
MQRAHDTDFKAAPLAPRGRWAQSPGPASFVARAGHATSLKIRRLPRGPPEPQAPSLARAWRRRSTSPRLRVPSGFPLGWYGEPLASELPDLGPGPGSRSPAQSPRAGSAPGGSRFRLRSRPLLLLVTSSLGPKESPRGSRSAPRGSESVGLAGCTGPWARPHSSLSAKMGAPLTSCSRRLRRAGSGSFASASF